MDSNHQRFYVTDLQSAAFTVRRTYPMPPLASDLDTHRALPGSQAPCDGANCDMAFPVWFATSEGESIRYFTQVKQKRPPSTAIPEAFNRKFFDAARDAREAMFKPLFVTK